MAGDPASDAGFQSLLGRVAEARDQGQSMDQMLRLAAEHLAEQPASAEEPERQELIQQLQLLQTQSPLLETLVKSDDPQQGLGALMQIAANLEAMRPESERQAQREEFVARLARADEEHRQQQAAHAEQRTAQGLGAEAGTGIPYPWVLLLNASRAVDPHDDIPNEDESTAAFYTRKMARLGPGGSRFGGCRTSRRGLTGRRSRASACHSSPRSTWRS